MTLIGSHGFRMRGKIKISQLVEEQLLLSGLMVLQVAVFQPLMFLTVQCLYVYMFILKRARAARGIQVLRDNRLRLNPSRHSPIIL